VVVSATSFYIISTYYWYHYWRNARARLRRLLRAFERGPRGKYYHVRSLHGERRREREAREYRLPPNFMGYIRDERGIWRLRTPILDLEVPRPPSVVERVVERGGAPLTIHLTPIDISSERFHEFLKRSVERVRRIRRAMR